MAKKILIVEDDKFLRDLITQKLSNENFDVVIAQDGEEGIRKIEDEKPDLVILDLLLPQIDGFEVLKRMKANQKIADTPVIILSNLGQKEDVERGMALGAKDYMIKAHFTPNEVIDKVKKYLE